MQLSLTQATEMSLSRLTQLLPSDYDLLDWLLKKSASVSLSGAKLLKMINDRYLFKRVLVLSHKRKQQLWDKLIRFREHSTLEEMINLQQQVQTRIVDTVKRIDNPMRRSNSILNIENTDKVIALHEGGDILITIDIPLDRPGSNLNLEYLPEADRQAVMEQWSLPAILEDSIVWSELNNRFLEATAKVRVFGHRDVAEIIRAAIERRQLEDILEASLARLS
jgi:hypothetical protein